MSYEGHLFFGKCSKFDLDCENAEKHQRKVFCFWDNWTWIGCIKYCLLISEYLSTDFNMLTNRLKILHITKRDFLQFNCLPIDQKIWYSCCRADFSSGDTRLPYSFWKGNLKRDFLHIYLTTFFAGRSVRNKYAMRVIFFLKMFKI